MISCALCGYEFAPVASCPSGCPLKGACHFVCCPRCGYQNVDAAQASSVKFVQTLWRKYVASKTEATGGRHESERGE
jgi:hypothetical protein